MVNTQRVRQNIETAKEALDSLTDIVRHGISIPVGMGITRLELNKEELEKKLEKGTSTPLVGYFNNFIEKLRNLGYTVTYSLEGDILPDNLLLISSRTEDFGKLDGRRNTEEVSPKTFLDYENVPYEVKESYESFIVTERF